MRERGVDVREAPGQAAAREIRARRRGERQAVEAVTFAGQLAAFGRGTIARPRSTRSVSDVLDGELRVRERGLEFAEREFGAGHDGRELVVLEVGDRRVGCEIERDRDRFVSVAPCQSE